MPLVARALNRFSWLVPAYLILGAPVSAGAVPPATAAVMSGQGHHAIVSIDVVDSHDTPATLTPVTRHIDDAPDNDADTVDPAGPPPPALALTSPARACAQSAVLVSCAIDGLPSDRFLGPLGSRPPPFSF